MGRATAPAVRRQRGLHRRCRRPRLLPGPVWTQLAVRTDGHERTAARPAHRRARRGRPSDTPRCAASGSCRRRAPTALALRAESSERRTWNPATRSPRPATAWHRAARPCGTSTWRGPATSARRRDRGGGPRLAAGPPAGVGWSNGWPPGRPTRSGPDLAATASTGWPAWNGRASTGCSPSTAQAWASPLGRRRGDHRGRPDDQLAARFAVFHLLAAAADDGEAAVGARGLTGAGLRRPRVLGRRRLRPACARGDPPGCGAGHARVPDPPAACRPGRGGRAGAPAAHASPGSPRATAPTSPLVSGRGRHGELVPIRTGQHEEHIVADVAWAACEYAAWTGDAAFLAGPGRDLVLDTARYWASRVQRRRATGAPTCAASWDPTSTTRRSTTTPSPT